MKLTELPSWMSPAPPNWGTTARGKLTADQWMVVCTVHLPITLIRIWGNLRDRRFSLLCNFMDLTSSVQLADQRAVNERIIRDSEILMSRYLNSMKALFKDAKIQPIYHVALHAGDFLRYFGPNHSVRAFGGERYLEVLGLQNVNNKSGPLNYPKDVLAHLIFFRRTGGNVHDLCLQKFQHPSVNRCLRTSQTSRAPFNRV